MLSAMAGFALVVGLLTLVPGVDTVLVLQAATTRGRAVAAATVAGICGGLLVWGVAAALGVSALLSVSRAAFDLLQAAGAVYLLWLGGRLLLAAWRGSADPSVLAGARDDAVATAAHERWAGFRRGLLTNLLNPKIGVFYLAVLPQFVPADVPAAAAGIALAMVHVVETVLWFSLIVTAVHLARAWFARTSVRRAIDAVSGSALVGFGLVLLARRAPA